VEWVRSVVTSWERARRRECPSPKARTPVPNERLAYRSYAGPPRGGVRREARVPQVSIADEHGL